MKLKIARIVLAIGEWLPVIMPFLAVITIGSYLIWFASPEARTVMLWILGACPFIFGLCYLFEWAEKTTEKETPSTQQPDLTPMNKHTYRLLNEGEIVLPDDEQYDSLEGEWQIQTGLAGMPVQDIWAPIRRVLSIENIVAEVWRAVLK